MLSTKIIILAIIALLSIDTSHRPLTEIKGCFRNLKNDIANHIHNDEEDDKDNDEMIIYFKEDKGLLI